MLDSIGTPAERRDLLVAAASTTGEGGEPEPVGRLARDRTGPSCLAGAVGTVCGFPRYDQVSDALAWASHAPDPQVTTAVTGALLGALHGVEALPVSVVSRLDLAWVADTLALDLIRERTESPSGSEYFAATDPYWWPRYMSSRGAAVPPPYSGVTAGSTVSACASCPQERRPSRHALPRFP